jgi:hypothetical protein
MNGPGQQAGLVLASALMLFAVLSLSMGTVFAIATRELARTSIHESLELTSRVAETALSQTTATVMLEHTAPAVLQAGITPEGVAHEVSVRFLGTVDRAGDDPLLDWHFLLSVIARSPAGAAVAAQLQVRIPAPAPIDPAPCLDPGCPVPPLCGPLTCDPPLRAAAEPVVWHLPETP